ncbi:MAG TPA: D-alanine--D-alanine ligase family protein [Chthoniobacterales bacterium]|nr:D-alanine--D-alanine ligase family protein [Chthoniobacterales bacterium]
MKKLRVAVLYGGRSGEHEVSLQSAASVINHLDRDRFEIVPVAIDKQGRWLLNDISLLEGKKSLPVFKNAPKVVLPPNPADADGGSALIHLGESGEARGIDVVFPVMHGPLCEDGTIQGLLELADLPYVGCGVLASAIAMDKEMAKRVARDAGIPIVPYVSVKHEVWKRDKQQSAKSVVEKLGYPVFVKPANLGSSVGVHKVKEPSGLNAALEDAFNYDRKVLVEAAVNAREIELSVLENVEAGIDPLVSIPGEIDPAHEFYSYEAKYLDENGAALIIPAMLTPKETKRAQEIGRKVFAALECEGMARVDLFLDRASGEFFFNELNTIPGFTSISMYPKLWEASGISYRELLSKLVDLAISRHEKKKTLVREFRIER